MTLPSDPKSRRSRRLFIVATSGLVALLLYQGVTAEVIDPVNLYQGLLILALAGLPSLLWARKGGESLPAFEVLMLTTAGTYGLPMLDGRNDLQNYGPEVITRCGNVILLFQIVTIGTFLMIRGWPRRTPFFTEAIFSRKLERSIGYGLVLSTSYAFVSIYYPDIIPRELNSVLRAVFSGIGLVSIFVQTRRWGEGHLKPGEKGFFITLLSAQIIMQFSTLFLVAGISAVVLALVGYISGSRKIPFVVLVPLVAVVAILHNGKSAMRDKFWEPNGARHQVEVAELPTFFSDWIEHGLSARSETGEQQLTKKLVDRTSLVQIICLVVARTPERDPYLQGETYAQIPGQFVPRFFWPEKPRAHISTYTLSIYYGLQTEEGTQTTTIGFGMVAEAYANFGYWGVGLLGALLGGFYKKVRVATTNSPLLSYAGLFLVVLLAWSFQTEMTLSIWLTSMAQACVAVIGVPFIVRNVLGD